MSKCFTLIITLKSHSLLLEREREQECVRERNKGKKSGHRDEARVCVEVRG